MGGKKHACPRLATPDIDHDFCDALLLYGLITRAGDSISQLQYKKSNLYFINKLIEYQIVIIFFPIKKFKNLK